MGPRIRPGASLAGSRLIDLRPTGLDLLGLSADPEFLASLDGRDLSVSRLDEPSRGFIPPLRAAATGTGQEPAPAGFAEQPIEVGIRASDVQAPLPQE